MKARIIGSITASVLVFMATAAFAGGPLILFDPATRDAYAYPPGNVDVYTDLGSNGNMTGAESDAATAYGFGQWSAVASAYLSASVTGDFASVGLPDITGANAGMVVGTFNGGGIHVMYDNDGTITSNFFGAPPGVLGIASPDFATTGTDILLESWAMLNGTAADVGGALSFGGVFTHEFGHSINLAHTQTNGAAGFFGDGVGPDLCAVPFNQPQTISDFETMYPFLDPSIGSTGEYQRTVDHLDDIAALSDVYPTGGWPNNTGTITGIVTDPTGLLELTGINVIARNIADPYVGANSALTGDWTQGDLGPDGLFTLNGLTPGAEYILFIDEIVAGGFSTPPSSIPGDGNEEYWNASESSDPGVDAPCDYTLIVPVAGVPSTNNIIVNGDPFNLDLGDDDYIEVPLPFTFTFCAVPYNTVFVGSNGFVTFGEGDTDFSESVDDLLDGPARICGVWDDLNPSQGGSITAMPDGGNFVVAFNNVPEFFATGGNSFTITLRPDNTFDVDYGTLTLSDGMAGRTPGNGEPDPGATDLSAEPQPIGGLAPTGYEQFFGSNDLGGLSLAYAPCTFPDPPEIVVAPTSLSAWLLPDEMTTKTLSIMNLGDLDLVWKIRTSQDDGSPAQGGVVPKLELGPAGDNVVSDPVRLARITEDNAASSPTKPDVSPLKVHLPHVFALNLLSEDFNSGFPAGWSVVDNIANGVTWEVPQQGEPNITGGTGDAAGASSDWVGPADYDTELRSPPITGFGENVVISYVANFQNFAAFDFLDLDISTDGGTNWTTVLSWNEDHGSFSGPGEQVALNLDPFLVGATEFMVRWRWYDPRGTGSAWNWFAQVDDVMIVSDEILIPCDFISSVAPDLGTIPGDGMQNVDVTFDATGFAPGNYDCELIIFSNAFNEPRYVVPLHLRVAQEVTLDIKPQHCPNVLRRFHDVSEEEDEMPGQMWGDNAAVKAVVLGGPGIDVSMIDLASLKLEGVSPRFTSLADKYMGDCSGHRGGAQCKYDGVDYSADCENVCQKKDGTSDLLMTFINNDIVMAVGDVASGVPFVGTLTGEFLNGTALEGNDCLIVIVNGGGNDGGVPAGTSGPAAVALGANVPNPFNPTTTISFSLVTAGHVNITVFDVKGRVVAGLVNEVRSAGDHSITWNADNLASGIYFYRMTTGNFTQTRRMVLLK